MKRIVILLAVLSCMFALSCGGGGGGGSIDAFTISYDANGAETGSVPARQSGDEDTPQAIADNTGNLVKNGYLFDGWNTKADGSGTDYAPGASYKGDNITLYAKWAAIFQVSVSQNAPALNSSASYVAGNPTATITGLTARGKQLSNIFVPSTIDGVSVTSIGEGAFQDCTNIVRITFAESVGSLGTGVFTGCTGLTSIIFQRTIPPEIPAGLFDGLAVRLAVPAESLDAYKGASGWDAYASSIAGYGSDPVVVTFDSQGAEVPASPASITIEPPEVTIGSLPTPPQRDGYLFKGYYTGENGTGIEFTTETIVTGNITVYAKWEENGSLYCTTEIDGGNLYITGLTRDGLKQKVIVIPPKIDGKDVYGIYSDNGFYQVYYDDEGKEKYIGNLANIFIPSSVEDFEGDFRGCINLECITVDSSNPAYCSEDGVLYNKTKTELLCCPAKKQGSFTIPNGVTYIDDGAFCNCRYLTEINMPNTLRDIDDHVFEGCQNITSLTFPSGITSINSKMLFADCINLAVINLPDTVMDLWLSCENCPKLENINVDAGNSVYSSDNGVLYNKSKTKLYMCPPGKRIQTFTIPNTVTAIEDNAFDECENITTIIIPSSVSEIGTTGRDIIASYAFSGCNNLVNISVNESNENYSSIDGVLFNKGKSVLLYCPGGKSGSYSIPNGVTTIGYFAFDYFCKLTEIIIPETVTNIEGAFNGGYDMLSSITVRAVVPPSFDDVNHGLSDVSSIRVPMGSVEAYRTAPGWSEYASIISGY